MLTHLNKIRAQNNMTYQQVADIAGLSKEHYWMIENGKRGLSYPNAVKIASVFQLQPDDIFLESELTSAEQNWQSNPQEVI